MDGENFRRDSGACSRLQTFSAEVEGIPSLSNDTSSKNPMHSIVIIRELTFSKQVSRKSAGSRKLRKA